MMQIIHQNLQEIIPFLYEKPLNVTECLTHSKTNLKHDISR